MNRGTLIDREFMRDCEREAHRVLSAWCNDMDVRYHGDELYAQKDYSLRARHSWGTCQCYWNKEDKEQLYKNLRAVGATNISGTFSWNDVYIRFDIKKSRLKKDGISQA